MENKNKSYDEQNTNLLEKSFPDNNTVETGFLQKKYYPLPKKNE